MTASRSPNPDAVCGAKLRQQREDGRETCQNTAGKRTDHLGYGRCYLHGGRAPGGRKAAQREAATDIMRTYGVDNPLPTDPVEGLLAEIARTAGHIAWLGREIGDMLPGELISGEKSFVVKAGFEEGTSTTVVAGTHVLLELYLTERKHFARVCAEAVRAGIAERQIQLAENQGRLFGEFLTAILDGLSLSEEQARRVPDLIERHLRLVG